ncbi:MAG TPA: hypothetical protein VGN00_13500 [Puia sp.]|jgi:hypothetical protein
MNYPIEILPSQHRKWIDCPLGDYFLIRHFELKEGEEAIDPETGNIRVKNICSPKENISDLSMSLLGIFTIRHINLKLTQEGRDKYLHYCQPDEVVLPPSHNIDFSNDANRRFWCISISRLNGKSFNYSRNNSNFSAVCRVHHTPMRWNFWHFSLRWETDLGPLEEMDERERNKIAQRLGHSARTIISHFARVEVPTHPVLPTGCYSNN